MRALKLCFVVALALSLVFQMAAGQRAMNADATTHLLIRFEAKQEHLAEFAAIMRTVERDMAAEPGFESAVVYQDSDDPRVFMLVEVWQSRRSHEAHFERIVASGDWANILAMLRSDPVMGYFDVMR